MLLTELKQRKLTDDQTKRFRRFMMELAPAAPGPFKATFKPDKYEASDDMQSLEVIVHVPRREWGKGKTVIRVTSTIQDPAHSGVALMDLAQTSKQRQDKLDHVLQRMVGQGYKMAHAPEHRGNIHAKVDVYGFEL